MRIVIVGASGFGIATATDLLEAGHEVVLIEQDKQKIERLRDSYDFGLIEGDGSLPSIQRDAFGDHADALVLLTNVDDVNILAAIVGREVGFERVIPQIVRPELRAVCEELGLDDLITPHTTIARSIVRAIEAHSRPAIDLSEIAGLQVLGFTVPDRHDGKTIAELGLPDRCRAIAVRGDGDPRFLSADSRVSAGEEMLVAAADEVEGDLQDLFADGDEK